MPGGRKDPPSLTVVRGVIGSETEPFFRDLAVAAVFAVHGLAAAVAAVVVDVRAPPWSAGPACCSDCPGWCTPASS